MLIAVVGPVDVGLPVALALVTNHHGALEFAFPEAKIVEPS